MDNILSIEQKYLDQLDKTLAVQTDLIKALRLINSLADALGTAERGDALVEVARNAHKAEQAYAAFERHIEANKFPLEDRWGTAWVVEVGRRE